MSADAAHARVRRAFEPEHATPDDAARARAARFADRELDVLAEQGNFERARVLLGRRAGAGGAEPDLYLDAIRLERSASPAGAAWQAWASRALSERVEIASALLALVPERELCGYLIGQEIGWATLGAQRDRAAARALLRMRLEQQLRDDPLAALAAIDDRALREAAVDDPALRALVTAVLAGATWDARDRALSIAQSYGIDASMQGGDETRAALANAVRLQPAWIAAHAAPCPGAVARFVRCAPVASRAALGPLARELLRDLRAQPAAYLDCADRFARAAPELGTWLIAECDAARAALSVRDPMRDPDAIESALAAARRDLRSSLARFVPWPFRGTLDRRIFGRTLRPVLRDAIVQHGATVAALCTALRAPETAGDGALALLAEGDRGLAILSALAAFAHTTGA